MPEIQTEPKVKSSLKKYDQVTISCQINPTTHIGTTKIVSVERIGIPVDDKLVEHDNHLVDQSHTGLSKFWFPTGTVKVGDVYEAIEKENTLVIGEMFSKVVVKTKVVDEEKTE